MADPSIYSNVGAIIQETVANNKVFKGEVFTVRRNITITAGATANVLFDMSGVEASKVVVVLPPTFVGYGGSGITAQLFVGAEYSGGTDRTGVNRSQNSANVAGAKIIENPTITTPGVAGDIIWRVFSSSSNQASTAGNASSNLPFFMNKSYIQRILLTNLDGSNDQVLEYDLTWFEFEF